MNIDAVEQRAGDFGYVALDHRRCAVALPGGTSPTPERLDDDLWMWVIYLGFSSSGWTQINKYGKNDWSVNG